MFSPRAIYFPGEQRIEMILTLGISNRFHENKKGLAD